MSEELKRQNVTLDDLKSNEYINLRVGESAEFTIAKFEKVKVDEKFALPSKEVGEKLNYRYEITTTEDKILSVNVWKLYGALREALKDVEEIVGTKLSVIHAGHSEYEVKVVN